MALGRSSTWVDQGRSVTMAGGNWNNPWKLTTIALALVGATALATGLVVANWTGKGAGTGAAIGGLVGAGGGTLYGLNENQKHDQRYRDAYASCMRSRGYTG